MSRLLVVTLVFLPIFVLFLLGGFNLEGNVPGSTSADAGDVALCSQEEYEEGMGVLWQRIAQLPLVTSVRLVDSNDWLKIAAGKEKEDRNKIQVRVSLVSKHVSSRASKDRRPIIHANWTGQRDNQLHCLRDMLDRLQTDYQPELAAAAAEARANAEAGVRRATTQFLFSGNGRHLQLLGLPLNPSRLAASLEASLGRRVCLLCVFGCAACDRLW